MLRSFARRICVPARGAFVILALAVAAAACASSDGVATVEGEPVTFDEVAALIPAQGDTTDAGLFARSLMLVISDRVLRGEAERQFGVTLTDQDVDAKVEELVALSGQNREDLLANYNLTETSLRSISGQQLLAERVIEELAADRPDPTDEELMERYEAMLPGATEVCSSHILLETVEEAEEALERARIGEDFAELAMELSTGPSGPGGGDLGCSSPEAYVAEFAAAVREAEIGVPYGPVETQFGWHVVLVTGRTVPSFEDLRERIVAEIRASGTEELWVGWVTDALKAADVQVEPEYGTWTTDPAPNVIPPSG